ncbi:NLR family CARD domain-containing protein 3 [Labeo rohita]|uniref:NLR family CARD domain-containing protein 3 n=1 Tax=Labeo rohita TaxID=84645 RepID=A0ABQ8LV21_LABRO|nr:NLR family CARD domain-containing protein 3 [Labeo rohita]
MSLCEMREEDVHTHKAASPEPSCVAVKSDKSMEKTPDLSDGAVTLDSEVKRDVIKSVMSYLIHFVSYCRNFLGWQNIEALQTHTLLKETADLQQNSHQPVDDVLQRVRDQHKTSMKNRYESLFEGIKLEENQTPLNWIYTQLYIIEGESEAVNEEHEVLQMEKKARVHDTPIYCNDIFKTLHEPGCKEKDKIKTVLTKGIAGIGKTVSAQKFILDWTEGKANQDVDFMFVLPFRELNLIKDHQYTLNRLLLDFHPELQHLDSKIYEECKVVFIFDGLDESRITLLFSDDEKVCDVNESSSVGVLLSNLIRGELLPSALIWITSRPAATNRIPSKYINRVTDIQGFTEPQKEKYFRKRISDEHQASRIISHIRRSKSLHIMCHIPVFCWISATVLQSLLKQNEITEIPQTLTEMYIHFLLTQINMRNQKYDERDPEKLLKSNRRVIVKLAELAFSQLMRGNVIFYEEDLRESGIDVTDASVYSEIFKEESVIHQRKVYSFIHLSFQQFLAAFFVFYSNVIKNKESLKLCLDECNWDIWEYSVLLEILKAAVDKSLQSKNGHLDLFLRFLLGVSLESNQRLLQDLLTHTVRSSEIIMKTTKSIQSKIKAIAYMLQISEVLDEFDLKKYNTSDEGRRRLLPAVLSCRKALLADCNLSDHCCESLSSSLQSSNSLKELDLSNNDLCDSGVEMLSDGLKSSNCQLNILRLASCKLTGQCCESLSSSLQSSNSLKELDLSHNDLQDSGVKLLSDGLKSSHCQLNILRLSRCMVTEEGCCFLASALRSNPSNLRELDLSCNHPGQSLVKLLSDSNYRLENLNLRILSSDRGCEDRTDRGSPRVFIRKDTSLMNACDLTLDLDTANTHLTLSERNRKMTHVNVEQPYPDHPERFDEWCQVLCRESLTGRCYWEAEWSESADISVMYKGICRKGWCTDSLFGYNEKSWSLSCFHNKFTVRHNESRKIIPVPSHPSNRVGVYLDWPAGRLSFYSVSDAHTLTHLHTFNTTFTEPLYAGFGVYCNRSVSLC